MKHRTRAHLALLVLALAPSSSMAQTTWYVDASAVAPGMGSRASPFASIQYALSQPTTMSGDTVLVRPGTYHEPVDFLGKDVQLLSTQGPAMTVIDGGHIRSVVTFTRGEGPRAVLDGFTLKNGRGEGTYPILRGGGVLCIGSSPTLKNLVVRENEAKQGAGMYFEGSTASIEACVIEKNTPPDFYDSDNYGGGAYVACDASVVFAHCTFRENRTFYSSTIGGGGGVFGGGTYRSCTIEDNIAFRGSGVDGGSCNPELFDCRIRNNRNNSSEATASIAGGVYGPATLTRCTIEGNYAWFWGGGVYNATLHSCTVSDNTVALPPGMSIAGSGGGAAASLLFDCDVFGNVALGVHPTFVASRGGGIANSTATRCRIWGNDAHLGGGAFNSTLERCTVYGNQAATGGAVNSSTVRNSILWANSKPAVGIVSGGVLTISYSDVQGGFAGTGKIDSDPMFVSESPKDFHLLPGSPCIDTGDPTTFDPDGSRADMGAYPFMSGPVGAPDGNVGSHHR